MRDCMLGEDMLFAIKKCIKGEDIEELSENIRKKGIRTSAMYEQVNEKNWIWNVKNFPKYKISHQGQTGRCWIYAAFNMIRPQIIKQYGLKDILFSQNYIAFYDLLEKANYFLEVVCHTLDEDEDDRFLNLKLQHPIQDAGQWFFFQNIIEKYGVVTYDAMPDTMHSQNTSELISVLSDLLREDACLIRSKYKKIVKTERWKTIKQSMLRGIYRVLVLSLGKPPERFDTKLELQNGRSIIEKNVTSNFLYKKYIHENYNEDYCMLVNIPLSDKPYYENYKVSYLGNVWGAENNFYLNIPMSELKKLICRQIDAGIPVWFGCDSRPYGDRKNGIYAIELFDLKKLGYQNSLLDKTKNLRYGLSNLTHAMVIKGYMRDEKRKNINKWLVENSYGEEAGHQGYFFVSDEWFDLFVYEAVIHKKFLDDSLLECYEKESIVLQPWDILGALAE